MIRWTEAQTETLRGLQSKQNLTNGHIAKRLTDQFGIIFTRAMIRNKLGRMGLKRGRMTLVVLKPPAQTGTFKSVRLMDARAGQCRWPVGDLTGADMMVCGERVMPGRAWCQYHREIAREKNVATR